MVGLLLSKGYRVRILQRHAHRRSNNETDIRKGRGKKGERKKVGAEKIDLTIALGEDHVTTKSCCRDETSNREVTRAEMLPEE